MRSFSIQDSGGKKKRGGLSLLSGVEVSELRYGGLQILRGLSNSVRCLSSLSLGSSRGTSTPALFIDVFRPYGSADLRLLSRRLPKLALRPPWRLPARAFRLSVLPQPKLLPDLTFRGVNRF